MTLVSIVIPCHDYGHFLPEAIESVRRQTHRDIELIVVDYASTDDTAEVVARYPDARYLVRPNRGYAAARNDGLEACTGELVAFLDADDRLVADAIETSAACLAARPDCAFAYGHFRFFDASGEVHHRGAAPPRCLDEDDPYRFMLRTNSPLRGSGAVLYRRSVLAALGGYAGELALSEDADLHMRIARAYPICCNDAVVLEVRVHDSHTSRRWSLGLVNAVTAQKRQRAFVDEHPEYEDAYRAGLHAARSYWGGHLANETAALLAAGDLRKGARNALTLVRLYPRGLVDLARRALRVGRDARAGRRTR